MLRNGVVVAEGVEFSDGRVVVRWHSQPEQSTVVWDSINDAVAIHNHDGNTLFKFVESIPMVDVDAHSRECPVRRHPHGPSCARACSCEARA